MWGHRSFHQEMKNCLNLLFEVETVELLQKLVEDMNEEEEKLENSPNRKTTK
jgi:hypothetical protein